MKYLHKFLSLITNYYDKIILACSLIILGYVLYTQIDNLNATREEVKTAKISRNTSENLIEPLDDIIFHIDVEADEAQFWKKSYGDGSIFDPAKYVYSIDGAPYLLHLTTVKNPYTQKSDVHGGGLVGGDDLTDDKSDTDRDGIPDKLEDAYGMNRHDPSDAELDKDFDGFINREEFEYDTNIDDPTSRPDLIHRVRFMRKTRTPLEIVLKNINTNQKPDEKNGWDIMIEYKSGSRWKSDFLKIGEVIPEYGYKIVNAEYNVVTEGGIPVEQSRIIIQETGAHPISLLRGQTAYADDEVFELVYFYKNKPVKISVKIAEEFSLEDNQGVLESYQLISESKEDGVVVEHVEKGTNYEVMKFSASDKEKYLK